MHELSITKAMLDRVEVEARRHGAISVKRIKLRIGEFSGVVKEAILFSFDAIKEGTLAGTARLDIETTRLEKYCSRCEKIVETANGFDFRCPACRGPLDITSGREMEIEFIEL